MLNGVNDVLTPWTPSRILRIMEAAAASRSTGRGTANCTTSGSADDTALAMDSLLRLSNQQPDVAGRMMAAPLFAQRPLVEINSTAATASPSSSPSLVYGDAHRMCTHALDRCRVGWCDAPNADGVAGSGEDAEPQLNSLFSGGRSSATTPGLGEIAFAAEFGEPCLRGSFPDVASVVRHTLPPGCVPRVRQAGSDSGARGAGAADAFGVALQALLEEPPVTHRAALPVEKNAPTTPTRPASSLRLNLSGPQAPAPPTTLLWSALPPPSAVPVKAYGPPGHTIFNRATLAHTFTEAEVRDLSMFYRTTPRPFQVYSHAKVEVRRQQTSHSQRRSAMLAAGAGAAPVVGPGGAGAVLQPGSAWRAGAQASGRVVQEEKEESGGWSASSGWSSDGADDAEDTEAPSTALRPLRAVEEEPPTRPVVNRTWVDDDGELVLENGRVTIRKRKVRVFKNAPPPLPLPTMAGNPLPRPTHTTPSHSLRLSTLASAAEDETRVPVANADTSPATQATMIGVATVKRKREEEVYEESELPAMRKHEHVTKREEAPGEISERSKLPAPAKSGKRAKVTNSKSVSAKRKTSSGGRNAAAATLNTADVPLLQKSEIIDMVWGLSISRPLRNALLIGVRGQVTPEREERREQ